MNYFTQLSIELATQRNYLDQLFRVYPLAPDTIREINEKQWEEVETYYECDKNEDLLSTLLKFELFPIKDGYVPFLKKCKDAIKHNPETVNRICGRIKELTLSQLYEKCSAPKETNRQMGPLFRRWLHKKTLGAQILQQEDFLNSTENAILDGSDAQLKEFAHKYLGYSRTKGLDFVGRFNGKFVIGEAKFITDFGGHQNGQFEDAMATLNTPVNPNVIQVFIMDGVPYIPSKNKFYKAITETEKPIVSALLLRNFLYSI